MAEKAFDTSKLAAALDAADVDASATKKKLTLNDLPNDVLVSIFAATHDPRWVRFTFPCVCQRWAELVRSKDASPLHEELEVDFEEEVERAWLEQLRLRRVARRPLREKTPAAAQKQGRPDRRPRVKPSRVISWAQRRSGSVRKLLFKGGNTAPLDSFTSEDVGALVAAVGSSLTVLFVESVDAGAPLWRSLRSSVIPAGRLRVLVLVLNLPDDSLFADLELIGRQLAGTLEELVLEQRYFESRERIVSNRFGLQRFPESFWNLTKLRRLVICNHPQLRTLPARISSLKRLENLVLDNCRLSVLPKELGELTRLTHLDLECNLLGNWPDKAFPPELGKLKSLRFLGLSNCVLQEVPAFVGELKLLAGLDLKMNDDLQHYYALAFLAKNCPCLRKVALVENPY